MLPYRFPLYQWFVKSWLCLWMLCYAHFTLAENERLASPNGKIVVEFSIPEGVPTYEVTCDGEPLILPSRLGLESDYLGDFDLMNTTYQSHDSEWHNPLGERSTVRDRFEQMRCELRHSSGERLWITFRAYDEGIAFRYALDSEGGAKDFTGERTEFRFPEGTYGYAAHGTEGEYYHAAIDDIRPWCERPLTLEYASGRFASLTEAANHRYARMLLSPLEGVPDALVSALGGNTSNTESPNQRHDPNVRLAPGESTPWRVLVVGKSAGQLLENNDLLFNLNPPCALDDTSWIMPGKVMRDTTLTTENSKAIIEFAEIAGLSYVHLDARWYGTEDAKSGDATQVRVPDLDIQEIVRYGREKGVRLIVYIDRRQIKSQRDQLFPLFQEWGLAGLKLGFVDVGPQEETAWITDTMAKAAEHRLMLNIHDGYRATGNNRTYPNLMTVEGIRGNEHMPTAEHNCTLPFTRYITGIGDYTICYYSPRIQTTHAHQLAMNVVSFSPLQWIFWYDTPDMYRGEPEVEFFREVPTVWDDTKVIHGEIGKFATIARRSGDEWFVGTINNSQERELAIPLDFLDENQVHTARIYFDDPQLSTRTKVGIAEQDVQADTVINTTLQPSGGQAMWIKPAAQQE